VSHHDAVVVGIGLAGLTAATRLAQAGARVLVLTKGIGSTHLSGATIDVLGYAPERVERPGEALATLLDERPDHPYRTVGADGVTAALQWFQAQFAEGPLAPYTYTGGLERNLLLPTAVGVAKPSAAVPITMAGGDLHDDAPICVVGFRALKDFHATLLADNLTRAGNGARARAVELDMLPEGRVDANAQALARAFDDRTFRAEVAAQVVARLSPSERVAFPAALGIAHPHQVWSELEHLLGRPVFEVPTLPPSVPGMRVFATLREALRRAGGKVINNAVVTGCRSAERRVGALRARVGLRDVEYGADWVVLATGGFSAGGLELGSDWAVREAALGLPVAWAPGSGEERFRPGYFDTHPIARAGVATDADLRPVDAGGERVYDNVLAVGATLGGAEPWREKSGDGLSLATGFRAAEHVLAGGAGAPPLASAKTSPEG
jgi:glycerol-3-phosphate dehydrogenase subunit B